MKTISSSIYEALGLVVLASTTLLSQVQAVTPPPDGGYPGFNTAEGQNALFSLTTGAGNTGVGWFSLRSNTTGSYNTAVGAGTLLFNNPVKSSFEGVNNTAVGAAALLFNTTGSYNTATGAIALFSNTEGSGNTASGFSALNSNTTGGFNTANGNFALTSNTTGDFNTATGFEALGANTTGPDNTADGLNALASNTIGGGNTAIGRSALSSNTQGSGNTAIGARNDVPDTSATLGNNINGNRNTAVGLGALNNNTTGDSNTALGATAGGAVLTASNVICVGADVAGADVSNTTWMGNVYGVTTQSGTTAPVVVSDTGQLGTIVSSERFKKDIAGMDNASDAILSLRPVTFHYKADTKGTPQFGLIAEEVAKVSPALVLLDKEGKPYTVRYDAVNAMLLNEFLKTHNAFVQEQRKVQEQGATVARLERQIEALASGLQKVNAQLEMNKSAQEVADNR
jgi:hypothetical protein